MKAVEKSSNDWDRLLDLFVHAKNRDKLEMLFVLFMTSNERRILIDRFRLVRELLNSESSQREIADQLQLSISKITMGSKAVQALSDKNKQYLKKRMT